VINEEKQMKNENVLRGGPEYLRRLSMLSAETVSHLFWGCRWVNSTIQNTFNRLTDGNNRTVDVNKYMGGWVIETKGNLELILIVIHFVKYIIYVCRNRRVLPSVVHVRYEIEELLNVLRKRRKWMGYLTHLGETLKGIFE
jgi:cytochrome c oxidase assembly factor CtaG